MSVTVAVNDANVRWSADNWRFSGSTFAQSPYPGAQVIVPFTGTSISVVVSLLDNLPTFTYNVDGGSWTRLQVNNGGSATISLATGLSAGSHLLKLRFCAVTYVAERWDPATATGVLQISSFTIDNGATTVTSTYPARSLYVFGDSNAEGQEALGTGVSVANQDASVSYPMLLADLMGYVPVIIGVSSQGYEQAGSGNIPNLLSSYDSIMNGVAKGFSPTPTAFAVCHGINGGTSASDVSTMIANLRAKSALAPIFMMVEWNGAVASTIATGVTNSGDANAYCINTGVTSYTHASTSHLLAAGHLAYANDAYALMAPHLPVPAFTGIGRGRLHLGM